MNSSFSRIKNLLEALSAFLQEETHRSAELLATANQAVATLQSETRDPRLPRLASHLKKVQDHLDQLHTLAQRDFLATMQTEINALGQGAVDRRIATVLTAVLRAQPLTLNKLGENLLDHLAEVTGARRGFLLLYSPETTAAEVISARQFATLTFRWTSTFSAGPCCATFFARASLCCSRMYPKMQGTPAR